MSLSKDSGTTVRTGSETPPSIARDSPQGKTASVASSSTNVHLRTNINDADHPPERTVWLGELEPWMDDHYMVQVCSLFGWETSAIHIPRPPAAPNATKHPNNAGYCLLIFPTYEKAKKVVDAYGPDASPAPGSQPVLLPNSNRSIRLDWVSSPNAQAAIGKDPGPVDNAIEYSIFVGDIAADVTNSDLMNVFRNPNLGLRGDFPPRLIAPFLSCCNAKVMVDSITGISKGYGFVRFTSEADQKRALVEMQGLYCKSRPMRLSTATAKNKNTNLEEDTSEPIPVVVRITPSNNGPSSPSHLDPSRIRSITTAVAEGASARSPQRNEFHPVLLAKISQLSNTLGSHFPAYKSGFSGNGAPPVLPPPGLNTQQIQQWLVANPQPRAQLESILGNGNDPLAPSDPLNTTVFVGGLSPLISEDTLRTFFAPFGPIHYVKVPPGKSCGFVQFVRKADAERAIEALSGYSIGGSKVRLSWGRIPAAQGAAQAAVAAAAANAAASLSPLHIQQHHGINRPIAAHSPIQSTSADGPLSSEQALSIVERLVPALMAAANNNPPNGANVSIGSASGAMSPGGPYTTANVGGSAGLGNAGSIRAMHQPQLQMQHRGVSSGYRDPYPGFNNAVAQSPSYMHGTAAPGPYNHRPAEYGRNDYPYYDVPASGAGATGYGSGLPYSGMGGMNLAGSMSPAIGGMGMAGYGGGGSSVLEDQLIGTYGGGIHRLQTSSLRQGGGFSSSPGGSSYNAANGTSGFMGGMGGGFNSDYDADLGGYRASLGGAAGGFGGPSTGYPSFGSAQGTYANGNSMESSDRFSGRFNVSGGMNGFVPSGGNVNGLSGHGSNGQGSSSGYEYTEEPSPQFKAADILRQDPSGLASYLANTPGNGGGSSQAGNAGGMQGAMGSTSSGARANVNAPSTKANGHVGVLGSRGTTGNNTNNNDGLDGLSGVFGGFRISGDIPTNSASGGGHKVQLSPGSSGGLSSNNFATQQVFRSESGRYS